jgi:hypothetical protein
VLRRVLTDLKQHTIYTHHLQTDDATRVKQKENAILREIKEELKSLSNKITVKQPERAWAAVAAQGERQENARTAQVLQGRKARKILIKFQDKELSNEVNKLPKETILQKIREAAPEAQARSILGIKKNISGDIYLQTKDEETKRQMEDQDAWVKVLGQKAQVQRRLYAVIVHGVRKTDVDTETDIKATIRALQAENRPLHGFLNLHRIAWPKQVKENEKTHGSLIMEVATGSQANRMINDGVSIGSEIKICKLFARECRLTQYFNCH